LYTRFHAWTLDETEKLVLELRSLVPQLSEEISDAPKP
jgi:hypothetical protein